MIGFLLAAVISSALTYGNRADAIAAQMRDPRSEYVVVACHRGDWRNFPENSLPAIESVIRYGADIMELDVKMTKDSVLILSHDSNLLRCTNFSSVYRSEPEKSPYVRDLTYDEISRLSLKRAHGITVDTIKVPTLYEALACCKDRICVNVDQGFDYYDQILDIAAQLGTTGQILIKSKKSIPEVAGIQGAHQENLMYMPVVDIVSERGRNLFDSYISSGVVPMAYEVCWNSNATPVFKEACSQILSQGSKVWVNTIWASLCGGDGNDDDAAFQASDPGAVYSQYLDAGVSMIQTDRPEMLIKWLTERGRHTLPQSSRALALVPYPQKVEVTDGLFDPSCACCVCRGLPELSKSAVDKFAREYGLDANAGGRMVFRMEKHLPQEAYTMDITQSGVVVKASSHRGFIYALSTLRQLLASGSKIPCAYIEDAPRFAYRGMHLDCARKYYSVEFIKKYLDIMAFHKLNTFHWHLTDDHGWRLEILKYPLLTQVGAFGNVGSRQPADPLVPYPSEYEGYYTQDDAREIVAYAASLGIEVIPEIDLPGHMTAAMAAYPYLGCTGGPYEVINVVGPRGKGLARDSLCPGKESTFTFLQDVLSEVMDIFPGKYIHLGGDECIKDRWKKCPHDRALVDSLGFVDNEYGDVWQQLEVWMIGKLADFVARRGRSVIAWDEVLEGEPGPDMTVMSWRGTDTGIKAAQRGYDVIMCPVPYAYFDYRQSRDIANEPKALAGTVSIDSVYAYDPGRGLSPDDAMHVIGAQANMWCDVIGAPEYVEYMLLPRLAALSEVQWCCPASKSFSDFRYCMSVLRSYYDAHGYIYSRHLFGEGPGIVASGL